MPDPLLLDIPELFESKRLIIRAPRAGDGAAVNAAICESLAALKPWMPWAQSAQTAEDTEAVMRRKQGDFLKREDLMLLIFHKQTGDFLGASGLHRIDWAVPRFEIGYWLRSTQTGHGYMTEAVHAITAFAFDTLGAQRVEIRMNDRNTASRAVAERCGYRFDGVLVNWTRDVNDALVDERIYSKTR